MSQLTAFASAPVRGYVEGYYGRLLTWQERATLLQQLAQWQCNTYLYAPKEDALHRYRWREPYSAEWLQRFGLFCGLASEHQCSVVAGIAPGLDFDFRDLHTAQDFQLLCDKAQRLLAHGAHHIALLMDDINDDFEQRKGDFSSEGEAHASLANALAEQLGQAIAVVPRIYAHELAAASPDYAPSFARSLDPQHVLIHSGMHIVSATISDDSFTDFVDLTEEQQPSRRVIAWDNLYANDYCPRRFFVGPWLGRDHLSEVLLNPTGMPATDALLIQLMAVSSQATSEQQQLELWQQTLREHGVPEAFMNISDYFYHPPFAFDELSVQQEQLTLNECASLDDKLASIDTLLWTWKTPLAREWYPSLFGLKHDLQSAAQRSTWTYMRKTQLQPLASSLAMKARKITNR